MTSILETKARRLLMRLIALVVVAFSGSAFAQFPIAQNFTTNTAANWTLGDTATLTGTGPTSTDGWLRLTDNGGSKKGYAYYNTPFNSSLGVKVDFEYLTWGGTGADGFTVFLFDGATPNNQFQIGDFGGSLGYANGCGTTAGLKNAYVGIAFDEFGNFSNPNDRCKNGGPGAQPDTVSIRGSSASNYPFLTSVTAPGGIDCPASTAGCTTRPATGTFYRRVIASIEPTTGGSYAITVSWQTTVGGPFTTLISSYTLPSAPPSTLKIGFAASTGGSTNYHEIRSLSVTLPADLQITKTGPATLNPQNPIQYVLTTTNLGPNPTVASGLASPVATITDTVPNLITGVTWTCAASGGASCGTTSGSGNAISLTATLPLSGVVTVTVSGTVPLNAAGYTLTNTATVTLPTSSQYSDDNPNNNTFSVNTAVAGFTVSGVVFGDLNADGAYQPPTESGVAGLTQTITGTDVNGNTVNRTASSAANGAFTFTNMPLGAFTVAAPDRSSSGYVFTTPASRGVTVVSGNVSGVLFGYYQGIRVTGTVFRDDGFLSTVGPTYSVVANANNGLQNAPETGVPNVTISVTATNAGGSADATKLVTVQTDVNGAFAAFIPNAFVGATYPNLTLRHAFGIPTGKNVGGSSIVLAGVLGDSAVRTQTILTPSNGQVYASYNFGSVEGSLLQPDQTAQATSPGSVAFAHLLRPGTLGAVRLVANGSFTYQIYRDTDCNGTVDPSERSASIAVSSTTSPTISLSVDATWPREASGQLKACALEVVVSVPAGRPAEDQTVTVTASLTWANASLRDEPVVRDLARIIKPTGGLSLTKQVRNYTVWNAKPSPKGADDDFATSVGGKPNDVLDYCITFSNLGSTSVSSVIVRDPVPFFTVFVTGSIRLVIGLNTTVITDATDADSGEIASGVIVVRVGSLVAGASGKVCYQAKIR
jgi:uncharacterized repeat protein (TIGR01451 family)